LKLQSIAATLLCVRCASLPCADAHGYKDIGALRLFLAIFSFCAFFFFSHSALTNSYKNLLVEHRVLLLTLFEIKAA
jgi:DMSO/TMAO reductase YedYZ heme-binding membrane subunit